MADILRGPDVAKRIDEETKNKIEDLNRRGIAPSLTIFRVGSNPDDLAYEKSIVKKCDSLDVNVEIIELPENVKQEEFETQIKEKGRDEKVSGILIFRPLPSYLDEEIIIDCIPVEKDIDGCTLASQGGVFTGRKVGFGPCTAEAVIRLLDYYDIDVLGKNIAVVGRSLVIGRPVAMMLMERNATVTNCHTKTRNTKEITQNADIIIASSGKLKMIDESYIGRDQIVIDVGINWDEEMGKISGDVDFEKVEPSVKAITPVPGGIGSITTSILISHVVISCDRLHS